MSLVLTTRRFTIRQGNAKTLFFRLRGQDQAPQPLTPVGTLVTLTMWDPSESAIKVIDAAPCTILDDGTPAQLGRGSFLFDALRSAALAPGVYEARVDALIGGTDLLTFPDDDEQLDAARRLLITVTAQA